jgi:beta-glucosidase
VVLLLNGRPLSVNLLAERADALIEGWYLGQETGNAVADILFGRANPGGKLPVHRPRRGPAADLLQPQAHGPPWLSRLGETTPLYPFGFGLSYTTFDISAPRPAKATIGVSESVKVEVDVTNTGKVAGDEVVQLYIHDEAASVTRPVLELKHFKRVTLAPGVKQTVTFEVSPRDLALWNLEMKRVVEPGKFTLMSGPNSAQLKPSVLTVTA